VASDWRSYGAIAERYDQVWGPRFEAAADQLLAQLTAKTAHRVLDIGTGTGAVLRVLRRRLRDLARLVGCDVCVPMLASARQAVAGIEVVAADAVRLPFGGGSFDLATASFVLSHVPDHQLALREALRVLAPDSLFGASNWAPATDPYSLAWRELLAGAVGPDVIDQALREVAPWEPHLADPENFRAALIKAGFTDVRVATVPFALNSSVEHYLAERELSAPARCARQVLGETRWQDFLKGAREELRRRFGSEVAFNHGIVIATGIKP